MKQEIIEAIAKDFSSGCRKSKKLVSLYKKMVAGKATYLDADQYALETAQVLGSTLHKHLGVETISGAEYKEIISEVLPEGLRGYMESTIRWRLMHKRFRTESIKEPVLGSRRLRHNLSRRRQEKS